MTRESEMTMGTVEWIKLADLTFERRGESGIQPSLWCRTETQAPFDLASPHDPWREGLMLPGAGRYDFMTYFNALSIAKWRKYANVRRFRFVAHVAGGRATFSLTCGDTFDYMPREVDGTSVEVGRAPLDVVIDVPEIVPAPVLVGITVDADSPLEFCGHWEGEVDSDDIRPVCLSLCTTTYRKEEFVRENVRRVADGVIKAAKLGPDEFQMHVVDNGNTLSRAEIVLNTQIHLHPNPNTGGSGGAARGIIESMRQTTPATHVILMDDDVHVCPESIVRTYRLLRLVRDEYADALVEGSMLSLLEPDVQIEDTGFMSFAGYCVPSKPTMRMSVTHDVIANESYINPALLHRECRDFAQQYGAWWYCCVPMSRISEIGLPMPFFVRYDDVEYGLRRMAGKPNRIMTMNGIGVWHAPFFMRYNNAVERYQVARNMFVLRHVSDGVGLCDFSRAFYHMFWLEMKRFNYDDAELALLGFEDFLCGPERVFAKGFAQQSFMGAHRSCEHLRPLSAMSDELEKLGIDVTELTADDVHMDKPRTIAERAFDFATCNGQRMMPKSYTEQGKVAIMEADGVSYVAGAIRRAETIVAVDTHRRMGAVRHRDLGRFHELSRRYTHDMAEYARNRDELDRRYRSAAKQMGTIDAWLDYLGLPADYMVADAQDGKQRQIVG